MSPGDVLPRNQREVVMALACVCLGVGASMVPGVTFEPAEATEMRTELAVCQRDHEACDRWRRNLRCSLAECRGSEPPDECVAR